MTVYIITSPYFDDGFFGTYSTLLKARRAFEYYLQENEDIVSFEDAGDYCYRFTTLNGAEFGAEIGFDTLDFEYEIGEIEE